MEVAELSDGRRLFEQKGDSIILVASNVSVNSLLPAS